jgi:hypothetical protein
VKGKLILQRERDFGDFFRKYRVYINGHERGRISRGGTFECELEPGAHTMNLKIDWCGSNSVSFVVNPDEAVGATCGSNLRGWRRLKAAQLMLDSPDSWIWLSVGSGGVDQRTTDEPIGLIADKGGNTGLFTLSKGEAIFYSFVAVIGLVYVIWSGLKGI